RRRQRLRGGALDLPELAAEDCLAPEEIERAIPRHLEEPAARLGGHAAERPDRERANERVLHRLLGEVEPPRAGPARQSRPHLARAVAGEGAHQGGDPRTPPPPHPRGPRP